MKLTYYLKPTAKDKQGKAYAWMLVWIDRNGKEHPRKP